MSSSHFIASNKKVIFGRSELRTVANVVVVLLAAAVAIIILIIILFVVATVVVSPIAVAAVVIIIIIMLLQFTFDQTAKCTKSNCNAAGAAVAAITWVVVK